MNARTTSGPGPVDARRRPRDTGGRRHVAFRLGQRDAFPSGDPSLQAALAHLGPPAPAANWSPWLALAAAHLMAYGDTLVRDAALV